MSSHVDKSEQENEKLKKSKKSQSVIAAERAAGPLTQQSVESLLTRVSWVCPGRMHHRGAGILRRSPTGEPMPYPPSTRGTRQCIPRSS